MQFSGMWYAETLTTDFHKGECPFITDENKSASMATKKITIDSEARL